MTLTTKALRIVKIVFYALGVVDPTSTVIKGLIALVEKLIQSKIFQVSITNSTTYSATPGTGPYSTAEDRAFIVADFGDGNAHNYQLPGPKDTGVFIGHGELDVTGTLVTNLQTALHTYAVGEDGSTPEVLITHGWRSERKPLKH